MKRENVILPKEVAGAIECLRTKFNYELYWLIDVVHAFEHDPDDYECEDEIKCIMVIKEFSMGNFDYTINAIVNGYEVEKSVEEKVRDYYRELVCREAYLENSGCDGSQHRQGWLSVAETLNILGIKIEGVNA